MKILVSIGGWKGSAHFSNVAASTEDRQRFVASAIDLFLARWPGLFDGFDLDWESSVSGGLPENAHRAEDKKNYTLLVTELRRQLDARTSTTGRRYLITIAAPSTRDQMANLELPQLAQIADWLNVMSYDYHTGSKITHFNAPLFAVPGDSTPQLNVHATIQAYLQLGVPARKLVLGLPFFGYAYHGVSAAQDGFGQAIRDISRADQTNAGEHDSGVEALRYSELPQRLAQGFRQYWHSEARVPWLFNPETNVWISYDDARSLGEKVHYATQHSLSGIMIWNVGGDDGTLLGELHARLMRPL